MFPNVSFPVSTSIVLSLLCISFSIFRAHVTPQFRDCRFVPASNLTSISKKHYSSPSNSFGLWSAFPNRTIALRVELNDPILVAVLSLFSWTDDFRQVFCYTLKRTSDFKKENRLQYHGYSLCQVPAWCPPPYKKWDKTSSFSFATSKIKFPMINIVVQIMSTV